MGDAEKGAPTEGVDRDELSVEVSGAVDNARVTGTFDIGEDLMRVVNTQPYPKGEHPLDRMERDTAPIRIELQELLLNLCGRNPIGIPLEHMGADLGTGFPTDVVTDKEEVIPLSTADCEFIRKKRTTQPLGTGDYEVVRQLTQELKSGDYEIVGEGEQLVHEIAKEVAKGAKISIHDVDTEKIELEEEERVSVEGEISQFFDQKINEALMAMKPDERLRALFTLQALKAEVCEQIIDIGEEHRMRYVLQLKNAIKYIIDGVVVRGINKSITLEIPNV